jgi:hypothetical protein
LDDERLVFDLMFALSQIKLKPGGLEYDETYRRMVAERIITSRADHAKPICLLGERPSLLLR